MAGRRAPGPGGADPVAITALPGPRLLAAVALRGASAVTLVDERGREKARAPSAAGARGVAFARDRVFVVGEEDDRLLAHSLDGKGGLGPARPVGALGLRVPRDVAALDGPAGACVLIADDVASTLVALDPDRPGVIHRRRTAGRPFRVYAAGEEPGARFAVVLSLIGHRAEVFQVDTQCRPRPFGEVVHDGPIWAAHLWPEEGRLALLLTGVEDRPLDRSDGFFGHVDSFLYGYDFGRDSVARHTLARNLSEDGVVTPKALIVEGGVTRAEVTVAGAGSEGARLFAVVDALDGEVFARAPLDGRGPDPEVPPGSWDGVVLGERVLLANPLLDALVSARRPAARGEGPAFLVQEVLAPAAPAGPPLVRLGEALATTGLMAERPTAEGRRSRFSCETCHLEMSVDGRTHFTGRERAGEEVHATTRPLFGLVQNRPHFTRALDETSAEMIGNEFRVVAKGTEGRPAFALSVAERPWLADLGFAEGQVIGAAAQREALLRYLAGLDFPPSPQARGRSAFTPEEARGAELFQARCASCHPARLLADEPASELPRARWERALFGDGPKPVWGRGGYEKTGVEPYVHEDGARPPSLRGLWLKAPCFTDGSAQDVDEVLAAFRWSEERAWHRAPPGQADLEGLDDEDASALRAFLDLL